MSRHGPMNDTSSPTVRDAAAEWFVRMRDEPVPEREAAAFRAWLDADPAHREAYRELERLWQGLDRVEPRPRAESAPARPVPAPVGAAPGRRTALRRMAIAASIAAAVVLGGYAAVPPGLLADHRTGVGEQRTVALADGSTVRLNTASAMSVEMAADRRRVTLHAGEAYFEVAADAARPFVVEAEPGRVTVLGTAFAVRRVDGDRVEVIVTKHAVEVAGPGKRVATVEEGQGAEVTAAGVGPVAARNTEEALSWRRGRLLFDGAPLRDVLAEIERYRHGRIVVMDGAAATLPVTAAFSVDRADAALATIEDTLPIRLVYVSDLLVLVFAEDAS